MSVDRKAILKKMEVITDEMEALIKKKKRVLPHAFAGLVLYIGAIIAFLFSNTALGWALVAPGMVLTWITSSAWNKLDKQWIAKKLEFTKLNSFLDGYDIRVRDEGPGELRH